MPVLFIALLAIFAFPHASSAHLAGGMDMVKDGYLLDLGFDPAPPVAGASVTFAFNLADEKAGIAVAPESVWVRITKGETTVFAGTFAPVNKNVTFSTILPEAGDHDITARFLYEGRELEGAYTLAVATPPSPEPAPPEDTRTEDALRVLAGVAVALCAYIYGTQHGRKAA